MTTDGRPRAGTTRVARLVAHVVVTIIVVTCAALGVWQLSRHGQLEERNALLVSRLAAEPRPYAELVAELDPDAPAGAPADATHRPVVVEGRLDPAHEVLLRGRTFQGRPGYHVLTPLRRSDGEGAVLVDRGWVPYRVTEPRAPAYAPPAGTVRVTGRLMPEEDPPVGPLAGLAPRDPVQGRLSTVARADADRLQEQTPYPLDPFLVEAETILAADGGADGEAADLPVVPPAPAPEAGPHIGYAIQWFAFALIGAIGYPILLRRRG